MSRELVPVGDALHLVDPQTGESVSLAEAPADLIAGIVVGIDDQARNLRDMRRELGDELVRRMDAEGSWTITAGGRKFSAPSPAPEVEWDVVMLDGVLDDLVNTGVITPDARLRALEQRVELRPLARGLAALEKIPGVTERLALCKRSVPRENRSVRVSRG